MMEDSLPQDRYMYRRTVHYPERRYQQFHDYDELDPRRSIEYINRLQGIRDTDPALKSRVHLNDFAHVSDEYISRQELEDPHYNDLHWSGEDTAGYRQRNYEPTSTEWKRYPAGRTLPDSRPSYDDGNLGTRYLLLIF